MGRLALLCLNTETCFPGNVIFFLASQVAIWWLKLRITSWTKLPEKSLDRLSLEILEGGGTGQPGVGE